MKLNPSRAVLLRDDPRWSYPAPTGRATRRLRVWRVDLGRLVAVVTESGTGMSVTNAAEVIAGQLAAEYPDDIVELIEHYPANIGCDPAEHFDLVEVIPRSRPFWRRLSTDEIVAVLGPGVLEQAPAGER